MDLMRRLRSAGRQTSTNGHNTRSHQSSSQQAVVRSQGHDSHGQSGRVSGPPSVPPTPPASRDPLTPTPVVPPVVVNNNHTFPWRFHSGVIAPNRSRRHLRPVRSVYTGIATQKYHCHGYPHIWSNWKEGGVESKSFLVSSDNLKFQVHPVLLAGVSPVFKRMFNSWRPAEGMSQVLDINQEILRNVLKFIYTGSCDVHMDNFEPLLNVAHRFQIVGLSQLCTHFLLGVMTSKNCVKILNMSKQYLCPKLREASKRFLLQNFKTVIEQPEFLDLDFEELESLLRDDSLNVRSEELALSAIKIWIEHAPAKRLDKLIDLLQCIRFGLMSLNQFANSVITWKHIATNQAVMDSLCRAQVFLTAIDAQNGADVDPTEALARPRIPYEIIFAIGGWSAGSPTSFMETYDVRADRWFLSHGSDVTPRAYHGLVTLGHHIYMIGGFDGNEHFNTMRAFDTTSRTWTEKANMHFPRCYISCCVLKGQIYAIGGFNGRTRMNSVERYYPENNQWEVCPSMTRQRSDASACALNGKLYVAGGFNGQEVLNSVEVFDPDDNQWSFIHPMRSPRSGVVVTAHQNKLYAIGGFNGFQRLSSVERYDPIVPQDWDFVTDMSSPRSNFAAAIVDDMIFVIGGFNGTTTIPYVECYDSNRNIWIDAAHMNLNRSALAACVLRGLPNACDFSYLSHVQEILGVANTNNSESPEASPMTSDDSDSDPIGLL